MLIYAHRGDHKLDPENTLQAFLAADAMGVDGIETDLRHTCEDKVVLYHNHAIDGIPVSELTHRQLIERSGVDVPTLDQVDALDWRCAWNLEIKTDQAYEIAKSAIAQWRGDVIVSSFLHDVAIKASRETGRRGGVLIAHRPPRDFIPLPLHGVDTLIWDWKVVDHETLRQANIAGWRNGAYGAVSAAEHRLAYDLGVSIIITDHPRLMMEK